MELEKDRLERGQERYSLNNSRFWITTEKTGSHILVDGDGNVVAGAGGKLKGKKFVKITRKSKDVEKKGDKETEREKASYPSGKKSTPESSKAKQKTIEINEEVREKFDKQKNYISEIDKRAAGKDKALRESEVDSFAGNAFNYLEKNVDSKYAKDKLKEYNERFGGIAALSPKSLSEKTAFLREMYSDLNGRTKTRESSPLEKTERAIRALALEKVSLDKKIKQEYDDLQSAKVNKMRYEEISSIIKEKEKAAKKMVGTEQDFAIKEINNMKGTAKEYKRKADVLSDIENNLREHEARVQEIETEGRAKTLELEELEKGKKQNASPIKVYRAPR